MPLIKILRFLSHLKKCNANDANFNSCKSELDSMDDFDLDRVLSSIFMLYPILLMAMSAITF